MTSLKSQYLVTPEGLRNLPPLLSYSSKVTRTVDDKLV